MKWPKEAEIIKLLKTGKWGIGYALDAAQDPYYWMQEGGLSCGKDGKSIQISKKVFCALVRKGLLINISKQNFGRQEFKLNEKGVG